MFEKGANNSKMTSQGSNFLPSNFFSSSLIEKYPFFDKENVWELIPEIKLLIAKLKGSSKDKVFIGKNVSIDPTARIVGPAFIGDNSVIGFNALIRENVVIFNDSYVGHSCELKNTILLPNSRISHYIYLGDSIVGSNVNIGAGAKIANWRFDEREILIRFEDKKIETHLKKFGAIIGDGCKIGANSVLNPGTVLGKNCKVFPLSLVTGFKEEGLTVK